MSPFMGFYLVCLVVVLMYVIFGIWHERNNMNENKAIGYAAFFVAAFLPGVNFLAILFVAAWVILARLLDKIADSK